MNESLRRFGFWILAVLPSLLSSVLLNEAYASDAAEERPNILWITIEDWGPDLSCYGTKGIETPVVDRLAAEGIRYTRAFSTSPVCSTSRSAMMTGFHQNFIGAQQHREYKKNPLPDGIKPIPHLLREAGYFTALMSRKVDCNFLPDQRSQLFEGKDWSERKEGQPFFARITFTETHRPFKRDPIRPIKSSDVELPPYYADTEFIRRDWANGLESMQIVDRKISRLLKRLKDEGLEQNTMVIFIGDHGRCHIRGKQFLYDGGLRIPMIVKWPGKLQGGRVNSDLVSTLDICATLLDVAKVKPKIPLHGVSLLDEAISERKYLFAARDRMGETHDAMRSIRTRDFKLILNLMPERPWCQYSGYKETSYPALSEMNVLHLQGKLNKAQASLFASSKPEIELFELRSDPHELVNVAEDPKFANRKKEMLTALATWRKNVINDQGVSELFRAKNIFPRSCPEPTVAAWVKAQQGKMDFRIHGLPPWFPTRTLKEWEKARETFKPWVFRKPDSKMKRPKID